MMSCFTNKVKSEKEIKLKEFDFKLLRNILNCNKNLEKWRYIRSRVERK